MSSGSDESGNQLLYVPQVFDAVDLEQARKIILTPEGGSTTEERWENETPYLVDQIGECLQPDANSCLLDYGCGIGRLSKGLIEKYNCWVVGVDISNNMRQLAPGYVQSERFSVCSPETLEMMIAKGFAVDHAIAIWVIQHCLQPSQDIVRIKGALKQEGLIYVLNARNRAVPSNKGWINDGMDVDALLESEFTEVSSSVLPESVVTPYIAQGAFIKVLQKA